MNTTLDASKRTLRISISSDILSTNAQALKSQLQQELDRHKDFKELELNLEGCEMIDSVGLNFVVTVIKRMEERSVPIRAKIPSLTLQRTFKFSRLDQHIQIL